MSSIIRKSYYFDVLKLDKTKIRELMWQRYKAFSDYASCNYNLNGF